MKPRFHYKLGGHCKATNKDSKLRTLKAPQPGCQEQAPPCCFSGVYCHGKRERAFATEIAFREHVASLFP
jgi:hypothetical protein